MITWENYEEYIMMHADGELQPAEEQELMEFLHANPELQGELATYEMIKLTPDTTLVFEDKKTLLKREEPKRIIAFPHWQRYAAAAGIAAIMIVSFFKLHDGDKTGTELVKVDTAHAVINAPATNTPILQQAVAAAPQATITVAPAPEHKEAIAAQQHVKKTINRQQPKAAMHDNITEPALAKKNTNTPESVNKLATADMQELPYTADATAALELKPVAGYAIPTGNEAASSFIDRLPIEDTKKNGLENVATALNNTYDKLKELKEGINDKTLTVKIEKRRLLLSF